MSNFTWVKFTFGVASKNREIQTNLNKSYYKSSMTERLVGNTLQLFLRNLSGHNNSRNLNFTNFANTLCLKIHGVHKLVVLHKFNLMYYMGQSMQEIRLFNQYFSG